MKKSKLVIALMIIVTFFLTGCRGEQVSVTYTAFLQNKTNADAWIWIGHDSEINDSYKVAPGQFKMIQITLKGYREEDNSTGTTKYRDEIQDTIKVNYSSDGKKVTKESLKADLVQNEGDAIPNLYIRYDGNGVKLGN